MFLLKSTLFNLNKIKAWEKKIDAIDIYCSVLTQVYQNIIFYSNWFSIFLDFEIIEAEKKVKDIIISDQETQIYYLNNKKSIIVDSNSTSKTVYQVYSPIVGCWLLLSEIA